MSKSVYPFSDHYGAKIPSNGAAHTQYGEHRLKVTFPEVIIAWLYGYVAITLIPQDISWCMKNRRFRL